MKFWDQCKKSNFNFYFKKYIYNEKLLIIKIVIIINSDVFQSPQLNCSKFNFDLEERRKKVDALKVEEEENPLDEDLSFDFLDGFEVDSEIKSTSVIIGQLTEEQRAQISCVFNPLDSKQIIADANKRPDLVVDMTPCQIDYIFKWCEVLNSLNVSTVVKFFESSEIVQTLREVVPDETIADSVKCGVSFFKYMTEGSDAQEYVRILVVHRNFLRRLPIE